MKGKIISLNIRYVVYTVSLMLAVVAIYFLLPKDAEHLIVLLRTGYDSMHQLALNRKLRGVYLAILSLYYRLHIPDFPELKSADVLRELFD